MMPWVFANHCILYFIFIFIFILSKLFGTVVAECKKNAHFHLLTHSLLPPLMPPLHNPLCVPGMAPVVLSQCTPCWWGRGAAGEQGPLHGNPAVGQVWGELIDCKDTRQGEGGNSLRTVPSRGTETPIQPPDPQKSRFGFIVYVTTHDFALWFCSWRINSHHSSLT